MPRMSDAEKRKSHSRIRQAAADLFRAQGIETTSLSEVMQAAGMTHGGFYRHFSGKDDLVAAAFETAVQSVVSDMEASDSPENARTARAAYIDTYLTLDHVRNKGRGCPMAALASELGRADGDIARTTAAAVETVTSLLREDAEDTTADARLALLIGAVTLARLVHDDARAGAILGSAKTAMTRLSHG